MRDLLTYDDICNEISMERTVYDGAYLLVEGVTDSRIYGKFLDRQSSKILIAHSRDNVEHVVKEMSTRRKDPKVLGIIDADLDLLRGKTVRSPLFYTDCRDMEMMAVRSNALNDVIDEYGDTDKVHQFEERYGPVREALVSASYPIGLLMYISQNRGYGLCFKNLDFNRFINPRSLALDAMDMVSEVMDGSKNVRIGRKGLYKVLLQEAEGLDDLWKAARGHDTIDILLIGLRNGFGAFNARELDSGSLSGALRLAFSDADFESTDLYRSTQEWSESTGVSLWHLESRSLRSEVLGPDAVGGLDDLLDAPLAIVQDRLAVVPQDDRALIDLQAPVQIGASLLQLLDELLELLHAGLEAHLGDLFREFLHIRHLNSSICLTAALAVPSFNLISTVSPTSSDLTESTVLPSGATMNPYPLSSTAVGFSESRRADALSRRALQVCMAVPPAVLILMNAESSLLPRMPMPLRAESGDRHEYSVSTFERRDSMSRSADAGERRASTTLNLESIDRTVSDSALSARDHRSSTPMDLISMSLRAL